MSLVTILVVLLLVGLVLWAIQTAVPLDPTVRRLMHVVVVVMVVLWVLSAFGLIAGPPLRIR